jgi:hypothetical protein
LLVSVPPAQTILLRDDVREPLAEETQGGPQQLAKPKTEAKAGKEEKDPQQTLAQSLADPSTLSVDDLKIVKQDECLQQTQHAVRLLEHQVREGHDSPCIVMGCINACDETVCGSPYCTEHEHHPVGKASFEVVRQVLIDFRESTGYAGWKQDGAVGARDVKADWDKLETYTTMEELGEEYDEGPDGVAVTNGKLIGMRLNKCNLTGTHPPPPQTRT